MKKVHKFSIAFVLAAGMLTTAIQASEEKKSYESVQPIVTKHFFEEAKKNKNWKTAFATGNQEQIVFMNISPFTNPNNEIGMEVHPFDQVIIIVEGEAQAILDKKSSAVKEGDMLFIPKGTSHNVVNLGKENELKIISFYSQTDIPKDAIYKTKADEK